MNNLSALSLQLCASKRNPMSYRHGVLSLIGWLNRTTVGVQTEDIDDSHTMRVFEIGGMEIHMFAIVNTQFGGHVRLCFVGSAMAECDISFKFEE